MILVTGANGFIGSQISRHFNQIGFKDLLVVDIVPPEKRPSPLAGTHYLKYLDRSQVKGFLRTPEAQSIQWVIHMGANSSTTETSWDHLLDVNVGDSQLYFKWCAENSVPFIYASSAATYGDGSQGFDDLTPSENLNALNLYGKSKVQFDLWASQQTETPPQWYGLKFFNVYGPQETHKGSQASVVFHAYHQIEKTGSLKLFKSYRTEYKHGEQKRDFIYSQEICLWIEELMKKKPSSGLYNMGTGKARSWVDLGKAVFKAMGKPERIEFIEMPENLKNQYQYFTEAKMQKWTAAGLSASKFDLESGVQDYVQKFLRIQNR